MKRAILSLIFLLTSTLLTYSQITVNPALPTDTDQTVITFDATQGNAALMNYTGDVYAHTGVKVEGSDQWAYVIGTWGNNTTQPKLTRIATNTYTLTISPSIRAYYNVPSDQKITSLCFVFRSADATKQTSPDIFYPVYTQGLTVSLSNPTQEQPIYEMDSTISIAASANNATSLSLLIDNNQVATTANASITFDYIASVYGNHWIKAVASDGTNTVADSVNIMVRPAVVTADLPAGVRPGINYIDSHTVTLVLNDPPAEKKYAFAIGDFSDWLVKEDYYMKRTPDGKYYWTTISGLDPAKEYGFQYIVDGTITIPDPYANKFLDPWNDKYIADSTYPGLKQYPVNKTTGMVSVFCTGYQPYNWQVTNFTNPDKSKLVVYELLVRDFTHAHSYARVADSIAYLKRLGVNVLELMPINEFDGNSSWGYNPNFYFAPDKYYGPSDSIKHLIDLAHENGIAVVLDMVLNHSYGLSSFVQLYFDKSTNLVTPDNPWYNVHSNFTNPDAQWGYDFNHDSPATQALVDSITHFWLSQYKVDGFRFDFTKGFSNTPHGSNDLWGSLLDTARVRILERMADKIWSFRSDAMVIFEHLSDNTEETMLANHGILLWGNLNNNYLQASMGWPTSNDLTWISYKARGWNDPNLVGYMESHDEERAMYKNLTYGNANGSYSIKGNLNTSLNREKLASLFLIPVPGPKMIWMFGELGYDVSIDSNGRTGEKPIHWDYEKNPNRMLLYNHYSMLINMKENYAPFSATDFTTSFTGLVKWMRLTKNGETALIIGNFDVNSQSANITFPYTGRWYEFFRQDSVDITSTSQNFTLAPGEYRMYTNTRLVQPDTYTYTPTIPEANVSLSLDVYPNPANGEPISVAISTSTPINGEVAVYNIAGIKVASLYQGKIADEMLLQLPSSLQAGIYLVSIKTTTKQVTKKLVVY